jgi:PAS domain S-box-containing protein
VYQIAQIHSQARNKILAMIATPADVRLAIENDELEPCFQPVVELHTGLLGAFEILARWKHPQYGLILPDHFISLAEESGLIGLLTQQILRKAFLSAAELPSPLVLAVNVSPGQLHDPSLPDQIREVAEEGGFPLERLAIEITESALIDNLGMAQQIARRLKDMGCKLALDDFGTGYSSLLHLRALPFEVLKVDRRFVSSMSTKRGSRKIVAAIIGLGHSLDMRTIAEGVETEEQAQMLLRLNCNLGQGWLYGHPLPADQIPDMVKTAHWTPPPGFGMRGNQWVVSNLEAHPAQRLAQLQAIYDGAPVGLCFLDRNLRYVSINQRLADMNGTPMEAYMGKSVQEMIPEVFAEIEPQLRGALKGVAIQDVEFARPSNIPGEPGTTNVVSYQPALDEAGEVVGISVVVMDITKRKQIEAALRESEDHLRNMVELNPEIPWVMDSEGNYLDTSSRWTAITGMSKDKTRNLGWLEAVHPEDVESTMKVLLEALHSGKLVDIEYRVKSIDRGWIWMRARGSPRVGMTGKIVRWYGSLEDINDRKQMQAELHKSHA